MTSNKQSKDLAKETGLQANLSKNDVKAKDNVSKSNDLSSNIDKSEEVETAVSDTLEKAKASQSSRYRKSTRKHHFPWITVIALLLVVVLGGANYWLYQQGEQLRLTIKQVSQQQSNSEQQLAALGAQISGAEQQQQSLANQIEQRQQAQQSIIASMDQMSQEMKLLATAKGKDPLFWRVSEVEYLLSIANHRLILERDVQTAKAALQDADKRLRAIGDPGFIPIREKIAQEIAQLEAVNLPDIAGMVAQIGGLMDGLSQLPFIKTVLSLETPPEEGGKEFSGLANFIKQVWADLVNGLFRVQRSDQVIEPLLPPEEKQYLLHNLGLKLEQARIALLQSNTALFQKNLADIERWIQNYFDQNDTSVINLLQVMQNLKTIELKPPLPDISVSLRELRNWLEQQKNLAYQHTYQRNDSTVAHVQLENAAP